MQLRPTSPLPCPECRLMKRASNRIGNMSGYCRECNRFKQQVRRLTARRLAALHPEEYERLRLGIELDLYPLVIEQFDIRHAQALEALHGIG
jgi:hypothetical protein